MQKSGMLVLVLAFGLLAGCDSNREFGRVAGGIAGAGIGNQLGRGNNRAFTTVVGAIIGSSLGERIGQDMDARNRERLAQVLESSRSNTQTTWVNPDRQGERFVVVPGRAFHRHKRICRPFTMTVTIDGETMVKRGVACRDRHQNRWVIVE